MLRPREEWLFDGVVRFEFVQGEYGVMVGQCSEWTRLRAERSRGRFRSRAAVVGGIRGDKVGEPRRIQWGRWRGMLAVCSYRPWENSSAGERQCRGQGGPRSGGGDDLFH